MNAIANEFPKPATLVLPGPTRRILIVDDDLTFLRFNTLVLIRSGYVVDTAADGAIAWETLKSNQYDLMLTDNNMPNVTGVELLRNVRASGLHLPVIMTTSFLPHADFTNAPWITPNAILIKPYAISKLLDTVEQILRESSQRFGMKATTPTDSGSATGWWL